MIRHGALVATASLIPRRERELFDDLIAGVRQALTRKRRPTTAVATSPSNSRRSSTRSRASRTPSPLEALQSQHSCIASRMPNRAARRSSARSTRRGSGRHPSDSIGATERRARQLLQEWRALLAREVGEARQVLREILTSPIRFTPFQDGARCGYRSEGEVSIGRLLRGVVEVISVASLNGTPKVGIGPFVGIAA